MGIVLFGVHYRFWMEFMVWVEVYRSPEARNLGGVFWFYDTPYCRMRQLLLKLLFLCVDATTAPDLPFSARRRVHEDDGRGPQ